MKLNRFSDFFIKRKLDKYGVKNYTINSNGSVDVNGDVDLSNLDLNEIPIKFDRVTGNFDLFQNNLSSLKNSPYYVGGSFYCSNNKLTSLKGSPQEVVGSFVCNINDIRSLEGMPLEIGGDFYISGNKNLKEFDSVSNIEGSIYCFGDDIDTSKFKGSCKEIINKKRSMKKINREN
jgi:hypothetical protein